MGKWRHHATAAAVVVVALIVVALLADRARDETDLHPPAPPAAVQPRDAPPAPAENPTAIQSPAEPPAPAAAGEPAAPVSQSEFRGVPEPVTAPAPVEPLDEWQRAFQDEQRDEAWARPLETQIRQSLEPQVNLGRFYISKIECRTTLCELRLLAQGSLQRDELERFDLEIARLPWNSQLTMMLSSGAGAHTGDERGYESIWIFEKKPEPAPGK